MPKIVDVIFSEVVILFTGMIVDVPFRSIRLP